MAFELNDGATTDGVNVGDSVLMTVEQLPAELGIQFPVSFVSFSVADNQCRISFSAPDQKVFELIAVVDPSGRIQSSRVGAQITALLDACENPCLCDQWVINRDVTNHCVIELTIEHPQTGQRVAGPFDTATEAEEALAQLRASGRCI